MRSHARLLHPRALSTHSSSHLRLFHNSPILRLPSSHDLPKLDLSRGLANVDSRLDNVEHGIAEIGKLLSSILAIRTQHVQPTMQRVKVEGVGVPEDERHMRKIHDSTQELVRKQGEVIEQLLKEAEEVHDLKLQLLRLRSEFVPLQLKALQADGKRDLIGLVDMMLSNPNELTNDPLTLPPNASRYDRLLALCHTRPMSHILTHVSNLRRSSHNNTWDPASLQSVCHAIDKRLTCALLPRALPGFKFRSLTIDYTQWTRDEGMVLESLFRVYAEKFEGFGEWVRIVPVGVREEEEGGWGWERL